MAFGSDLKATCLQRAAWNVTWSPVQALGNRELGFGHRRTSESNLRRQLLSSKFRPREDWVVTKTTRPTIWETLDVKSYPKEARIEFVFGFFWVTYPDPTSAGRPRTYKHDFFHLEQSTYMRPTGLRSGVVLPKYPGKATIGPVKDLECIQHRKSMSASVKRFFVTLTESGCLTSTDLTSPAKIDRCGGQILLKNDSEEKTPTHFAKLSWDPVNDRIVVLERRKGGGTHSIQLLDVERLSVTTRINYKVGNLSIINLVEDFIYLSHRSKKVVEILSVHSLCGTQESFTRDSSDPQLLTISKIPTGVARIPSTAPTAVTILDSFWPPVYISKSESKQGSFYDVRDFREESTIFKIPAPALEADDFFELRSVSGCSNDIFFSDGISHRLYKMERVGDYDQPQFNVSEHQPFENPTRIDVNPTSAEPTRRSTRVRHPVARPPTVVYDVKFSREFDLVVAIILDGGKIKANFYEKMSYRYCGEIDVPAINFPEKFQLEEKIKAAKCDWDLDYLVVRLHSYDHRNFVFCISLLTPWFGKTDTGRS